MKTICALLATFVLTGTLMMNNNVLQNDRTKPDPATIYQKDIMLTAKVKGFDKEEITMTYVVTMDMVHVQIDGEEYERFVDIGDVTYWLDNPDYAAINPSTGYPVVEIKEDGATLEVMQIMQLSNYEISETGAFIASSETLRTEANVIEATYELALLKAMKK